MCIFMEFMKTSHTHSLSFYFLIFQIATRCRKRAYLFKNKKNKKKAWFYYVILPYPILLGKKIVQVYAYFQWSHFRRSDSSMLILPTEKYNFMNAMIWEINFPWNDGAKNCWSMEWWCRPMVYWNQASNI